MSKDKIAWDFDGNGVSGASRWLPSGQWRIRAEMYRGGFAPSGFRWTLNAVYAETSAELLNTICAPYTDDIPEFKTLEEAVTWVERHDAELPAKAVKP